MSAAIAVATASALTACTGPDASEVADRSAISPAPSSLTSPEKPAASETPDAELLARAEAVQGAQQALAQTGRGTFTVELVRGRRAGVLPTIEGAYDFAAPAGRFTAVTEEADRTVRLRYRTRGADAWSQVLYPGSPLAPDCWYQIGLAQGSTAMPAQVSALLYLEPDPEDPRGERSGAVAELGDVLNAVGLTRLANLLGPEQSATRTPVSVAIEGEGEDARFTGWTVSGEDVSRVLGGIDLDGAALREVAAVAAAVSVARWKVTLEAGRPGPITAPPADRVLVAGDVCS